MDTLLIPCWRRAEFLHHTIDNLVKTGDLSSVHIVIKPDLQHETEITTVIDRWKDQLPSWEIASAIPSKHRDTKQSLNLLSGYIYAAKQSTGIVFMVEEDVMVGRDFFKFHRALHQKEPGLFCSLSVKNTNRPTGKKGSSSEYYLSHGDFCSLGVAFKSSVILDQIAPHLNDDYLAHPEAYCKANFPQSTLHRSMVEQDGLIRRIQEAQDKPTAYPYQPRAFHAGWYGYNRQKYVTGSLQQRIDRVGATIYNRDAMRRAALKPEYFADSEPQPLELDQWETLIHKPL